MADKYKDRQIYIKALIVLVGLVFVVRLGVLQIFETKKYQTIAEQQALRNITIYPARGLVYDRNGKLLVYNDVVYDLMVVPKAVKELDTADFCRSLGIEREEFEARMNNAKKWSPYSPSPFMKQISKNDYAKWQNVLYRFPGFFVQTRTLRLYPQPIAAHVLGYVGEVDENEMKKNEKLQMGWKRPTKRCCAARKDTRRCMLTCTGWRPGPIATGHSIPCRRPGRTYTVP